MDNPHPTVFAPAAIEAMRRGSSGRALILAIGLAFFVPGLLGGSWFLILLGGAILTAVLIWLARDARTILHGRRRRQATSP